MKMKRLFAALLFISLLLCLCACGAKYRDDVPLSRITAVIDARMGADSLDEMTSGFVSGSMHLDPNSFGGYVVKINKKGVNIDEYGVFRTPENGKPSEVKDAIDGYLKMRRDTWMKEYMPEEKPKLDKAEVKVYGNYILYVIADDEVRSNLYNDLEKLLKK